MSTYRKHDLQQHKKSDRIKWIATGIALLLISLTIVGVCLQLFGTGKQKPSEWFKKNDTEQTAPFVDEDENKDGDTATSVRYSTVRTSAAESQSDSAIDYNTLVGDRATVYVTDSGEFDFESFKVANGFLSSYPMQSLTSSLSIQEVKMVVHGAYAGGPNSWADSTYTIENMYYTTVYGANIDNGQIHASNMDKIGIEIHTNISLSPGAFQSYRSQSVLTAVKLFGLSPTYIYKNSVVFFDTYTHFLGAESTTQSNNQPALLFEYTRAASLPADPVKDGHTFVGWFYGTQDEHGSNCRAYGGEPIYYNTNLHAHFRTNTFTVTFDANGGSAVNNLTVDWNTAVTLPTTTRDKHAFKGWFLPNGTQYTNQPIKENTTLTAQWERNVFNVTFNANGGSAVNNTEANLNATVTLPTTTRTGYTLKGWFLPDGTEYTNQPVTSDISLTAQWEIIMCTVTFYVDGEKYDELTVEYGTPLATITEQANAINLQVMSVKASGGAPITSFANAVVSDDVEVQAEIMTGTDKVKNTVKNNKWAILGGVIGGVALLAAVFAIFGSVKRKKR